MKILFAGTPEVAAKTLRSLLTDPRFQGNEVVGVLTREDAPVGRKRVLTPSAVAQVASEFSVPTLKANRISQETLERIAEFGADVGVVIAYGVLFKRPALEIPRLGWFNIHFSLLPKYRGAAPVQRALLNRERETGVAIFKLDAGMDSGPIAISVPTEIAPAENAGELLGRLRILGDSALAEVLPGIAAGTLRLNAQDASMATSASKLSRAEIEILGTTDVASAEAMVRAANPEPVAFFQLGDAVFRVLEARGWTDLFPELEQVDSGEIHLVEKRVFLRLPGGALELVEVQPAGKRPMSALDWARGANLPLRLGIS